ncbi:DinB family protein [Fredinandcohnia humi]
MEKERVCNAKRVLLEWVMSLQSLSNEIWFKPFKEGAWGTADVISHFISWDRFVIENRIHPLLKGESFPDIQVVADEVNKEASNYARSGISKEELLEEFSSVRKQLLSEIENIPDSAFRLPYPGNASITLFEYFTGLIQHDETHKQQIIEFLQENKVVE